VVTAQAGGKSLGVRVRAAGIWGGCVAATVGTALALTGLDHTNPRHFLGICFLCAIDGVLFATAVMRGRLDDALEDKEHLREELRRVTAVKAQLESEFIRKRESSSPNLGPAKRKRR